MPVCDGLLTDAAWARQSDGPPTPAPGILLSIYLAIAATRLLLLFFPQPLPVAALLLVQVHIPTLDFILTAR